MFSKPFKIDVFLSAKYSAYLLYMTMCTFIVNESKIAYGVNCKEVELIWLRSFETVVKNGIYLEMT